MSSRPEKKYPISKAALSGASEPWVQLLPMLVPRSWRMVPGAAFFGSVAPMVSRHLRMAPHHGRYRSEESRPRSEEHTSELQSRPYLVCRLLLGKKNYS